MFKQLLIKHRGIFLFLFVVPFSFVVQVIQDIRNWIFRNFFATNKLHDRQVQEIQVLVKAAFQEGKQMCTARAPWKTMSIRKATYKDDLVKIPIDLKNILSFDREQRTIRVEPMVTMGDITHYLIKRGFALAVQVEMDDLTVGGLCMGIGIETTSHRKGFLFETIKTYEIITAEGKLVRASKEENTDLYHALPMSHGTLGFLVAVELAIVPVLNYMKIHYYPCYSSAEFSKRMASLSQQTDGPKYLEGLVFDKEHAVIMAGKLTQAPGIDGPVNSINQWHKRWFYTHVETYLENGEGVEYIPLRQYFHRHTPSIFFQLKDIIPFANQAWYRWLFAWMGAPKIKLMKYSMSKELRKRAFENRVAQDIIIPISDLEEALQLSDEYYGIYPLWICPVQLFRNQPEGLIRNPKNDKPSEMYVDVGIYGISPRVKEGTWNSVETGRLLEKFTIQKGGFHMLYADIFMNKKEFSQMFNRDLYDKVRQKYKGSAAFPDIYTKVIPENWLVDLDKLEDKQNEEQPVYVD